MIGEMRTRRLFAVVCCVVVAATGCAFQGVNSLPLPGAVGRGPDASTYRVQIANVGTLESNSPVLLDDVVVGSVGRMTVSNWHADVEISVKPDIVIPANAVASVGQTSLLGSMHLALNPPVGAEPQGRLEPGATIVLNDSSTYPSTEQTLSSLSAVVNGGGLGQIGDIVHNFNLALSGRETEVRELLTRLDTFIGTLDAQRGNIIASIEQLNRVTGVFAAERDTITHALQRIPPALDVLIHQRPNLTTALDRLGQFSDTTSGLVNDSKADLVRNLRNLEPTIKALADIGPDLGKGLAYATTFPFSQGLIDRGVRGDYMNLFAIFDLTVPRLKRTLFLGTRWGEEGARLVPAPGDPWYLNYTYDPLEAATTPPPPQTTPVDPNAAGPQAGLPGVPPMPPISEPVLPVTPPPTITPFGPGPATHTSQVFAGPYPQHTPAPAAEGGG